MTKYEIYTDPSHGWVKVEKKELKRLGIADKISGYSYMRGDYAYLEEDGDLSLFVNTKKNLGESVEFNENHTNKESKIRGYSSYEYYTPEMEYEAKMLRNKLLNARNWDTKSQKFIKNLSLDDLRRNSVKYGAI